MYCKYCGQEIDDQAIICVHCGAQLGAMKGTSQDVPSTILKVVSFLLPIVGLILFLVMMDDQPISAKSYGKMALIGFVVGIALIFMGILLLVLASGIGASLFDWII